MPKSYKVGDRINFKNGLCSAEILADLGDTFQIREDVGLFPPKFRTIKKKDVTGKTNLICK